MFDYDNPFNNYADTAAMNAFSGAMSENLSPLPDNPVVAMAYVPFQQFCDTYNSSEGFKNGTMFPELNKPFTGMVV